MKLMLHVQAKIKTMCVCAGQATPFTMFYLFALVKLILDIDLVLAGR